MKKKSISFLQPFVKFFKRVFRRIRQDKKVFITLVIFELVCAGVLIRNAVTDRIDSAVIAALAMILLFVPSVLENGFHLRLPLTLEIIVFCFVFAAEILGEIGDFYQNIPLWDTALHTMSGFMFAAFGFCIVDIFNQTGRFKAQLTPLFLTFVAFCFSITIGTLWEFFEFGGDSVFGLDMQKDFIINSIHSVALHQEGLPETVNLENIGATVIYYGDNQVFTINGYLDIGLIDTMKDMFVNFIGAVIFCIFGYIFIKQRDIKNRRSENMARVAKNMIPEYIGGYGKFIADADYIEGDEENFAEAEIINNPPKKPGIFSHQRKHEKLKKLSPVGALLAEELPESESETDNNEGELILEKPERKSLFKKRKKIDNSPTEQLLSSPEETPEEAPIETVAPVQESPLSQITEEKIIEELAKQVSEKPALSQEETPTPKSEKKPKKKAEKPIEEASQQTLNLADEEAPVEAPKKRTRKKKSEPQENN